MPSHRPSSARLRIACKVRAGELVDDPGLGHLVEGDLDLAAVHRQRGLPVVEADQSSPEAPPAVQRAPRLELNLRAAGGTEVLLPCEQPVEAGRRDLEPVGGGNRVRDVELGLDLAKIRALDGVREFPSRIKCATLAWHALDSALDEQTSPVTTE